MEDGERIPIEIGEVQAAATAGETLRADGTVVIDIQARACASDPETDEIVVCAANEEELARRYGGEEEPARLEVRLGESGTATATAQSSEMPMGGNAHAVKAELRFAF